MSPTSVPYEITAGGLVIGYLGSQRDDQHRGLDHDHHDRHHRPQLPARPILCRAGVLVF